MATIVGLGVLPAAAMAASNEAIVMDQVSVGGSGLDGQLVIGDTIEISGTWSASEAATKRVTRLRSVYQLS